MFDKLIKGLASLLVIAAFAYVIMFQAMPDLYEESKISAEDVSASVVVRTSDQKYLSKCTRILAICSQYCDDVLSEEELQDYFEDEHTNTDDSMPYLVSYNLAEASISDNCYEEFDYQSDSDGYDNLDYSNFTFEKDGNQVLWYCKEHDKLSHVTLVHYYEDPCIKELEEELPGLGKWLKKQEEASDAPMVSTVSGEKVPLHEYEADSKYMKGIEVSFDSQYLNLSMNQTETSNYEGITELYEPLKAEGWNLSQYYVKGAKKGFSVSMSGNNKPYVRVLLDENLKIDSISIYSVDSEEEGSPIDASYYEAINVILKEAGIDTEIDELQKIRDNGKGENYQVYAVKQGEIPEYYGEEASKKLDSYLLVIYDITEK